MSSKLSKGLDILELLSGHENGLSLKTISEAVDLSRSMAHRILAELVERGCVRQEGELSPYRLTLKLPSLYMHFLNKVGIGEIVQPVLDELAELTGELARMSLVDRQSLIWIAKSQGAKGGLRYDGNSDPGEEVRLAYSSNGHAWLSCFTDEKALELVSKQGWGDFLQYGPNAPRTINALMNYFSKARELGYAYVTDTYELGIAAAAVPVFFIEKNEPIGAVSIAGPSARLTSEKIEMFLPLLRNATEELEKLSGKLKFLI